jgi:hypothetical protein
MYIADLDLRKKMRDTLARLIKADRTGLLKKIFGTN